MDLNRANAPASPALADETIPIVQQPANILSSHEPGTDNPNNPDNLESRLRGLILSNGIPQKRTDNDNTSDPATIMESSDPSRVLLPPHMRLATPAEQQDYLAKVKEMKNVSSVPPSSARTRGSVQTPQKKLNQAQRRKLKSQLEMHPSYSPIANTAGAMSAGGMSPRSLTGRGAPYQTTNIDRQQARPVQQQAHSTQLHAPPTQPQARLPQLQARPTPPHIRTTQSQHLPAFQHPVSQQLQGTPAQQQGQLPLQQGPMPQQPPASSSSVTNRPLPMATYNPNASTFPVIPGHQHRHSGNPYSPHQGPIQQDQFARPPPQNRQLYQPRGNGPLGRPQQQHAPIHNLLSPAAIRAQVEYLTQTAEVEIEKAEMGVQDLQEKENLRLLLQRLCRSTIGNYERQKSGIFDESSIALECFGSLRSGFATRGSDMDLALVSPNSKPDTASPDSDIPRLLEKALLDLGFGARLLTRTRVPIIKFCEKPTPELADALRKARTDWEEERDAPPKPDVAKKDGKRIKAKETSEHRALKGDSGAIDGNAIEKLSGSEIPQTLQVTEQPAVEIPVDEGRALEVDTGADGKRKEHVEKHVKSRVVPAADAQESKEEGQGSDEDELPHRSDEELVRLYQLAISEGWFTDEERKLVSQFASAVEHHGSNGDHCELVAARIQLKPLSHVLKRYREPPDTHLDFPKGGIGIQCDINFSNHLALHNTLLLRCYSRCDPRVRYIVLFVKAWAKRRKINSPYHGTLSSYGYVLMVLHYLVNVAQPQLVPNLQLAWRPPQQGSLMKALNENTVDGYDVRFWRSEGEIQDLAQDGMLTHNRENVGSLLRGFFHYFAFNGPHVPGNGFSWTQDVLSLRTPGGLLSKQEKGWTGAKTTIIEPTAAGQQGREVRHRYLFAIEDPFEIDHNIARTVVHDGIVAIREEFRRAHRIIQSAGRRDMGPMEDLFAEGQEKEPRPRRAFGPLPRPPPAPKKEPVGNAGPGNEESKTDATPAQGGKASATADSDSVSAKSLEES